MNKMSDDDAAYLAGIIDGEGCVAIIRQKSHCRGGFAYRSRLHVANTNRDIMAWLQHAIGVGYLKSHTPRMRNSKTLWEWEISGDESASILSRIFPYLKIKRRQASLVMKLQEMKRSSCPGYPLDDLIVRESLYQQSRFLNHRGALPYEMPARLIAEGPDVSEIAKSYGGGGHKNAAGFRKPIGWEGDA